MENMKKILLVVLAVLFMGSFQNSFAEEVKTAPGLKIAYVDLQRALNDSEKGKVANKALNETVLEKQKNISKMEENIKSLQEQVKKQRHLFTEEGLKAKEEEIERLLRDYKRLVTDAQEELQKEEQRMIKSLMGKIHEIVKKIGKRDGYALILENSASRLLYADENIDITDQVIELFNQRK